MYWSYSLTLYLLGNIKVNDMYSKWVYWVGRKCLQNDLINIYILCDKFV